MEANESKIFVGNLPFRLVLNDLKELFSKSGTIVDATIITNKFSGRSRGFGFITYSKPEEAQKAIAEMNEKEVEGRNLVVKEAKPMEKREEKPREETKPKEEKSE